jgi:hypothetical protein
MIESPKTRFPVPYTARALLRDSGECPWLYELGVDMGLFSKPSPNEFKRMAVGMVNVV